MDYDLEAFPPSSRRSRTLSWLAATSGVALVLIALGSTQARSASGSEQVSTNTPAIAADQDPLTTSSIMPALTPVEVAASVRLPAHQSTLPPSERHVLILLLFACFTVMTAGVLSLWKRGWREITRQQEPVDYQ
ncbi:hypothetical protein GVN24_20660 [Rhizobium sp. CRIBSB]|nr:hypothetical protein [Rhizobium sp. CRIBSB]